MSGTSGVGHVHSSSSRKSLACWIIGWNEYLPFLAGGYGDQELHVDSIDLGKIDITFVVEGIIDLLLVSGN
jgi:hypothetical protein